MKQYGHDITLVVSKQLPKSEVEAWLDCIEEIGPEGVIACLLYTSPSPRD